MPPCPNSPLIWGRGLKPLREAIICCFWGWDRYKNCLPHGNVRKLSRAPNPVPVHSRGKPQLGRGRNLSFTHYLPQGKVWLPKAEEKGTLSKTHSQGTWTETGPGGEKTPVSTMSLGLSNKQQATAEDGIDLVTNLQPWKRQASSLPVTGDENPKGKQFVWKIKTWHLKVFLLVGRNAALKVKYLIRLGILMYRVYIFFWTTSVGYKNSICFYIITISFSPCHPHSEAFK